ncbi:uncharacterized protein RSE6_14281 [Rhynchosporium secalis]|uniref:Xylanolytic transcriptional activator regulatory domain-containing protein n=1 Tax=Rhynchosporium secalis TaxID=38038 RepID=A0A1E1MUX6_RHYSE|nr:uncharacterized protein RSE6_14281 [Rhynchosporium secalis]
MPVAVTGMDAVKDISGQDLFDKAERLMSIFEMSRGNENQSIFYSGESVRMAIEIGLYLHRSSAQLPQIELEVRSATIWGAFALDK